LTKDPVNGVWKDVQKLLTWTGTAGYLVAFFYPNPGQDMWDSGLRKFLVDFEGTACYIVVTEPEHGHCPDEWFIGVLELCSYSDPEDFQDNDGEHEQESDVSSPSR
jgi:hypothetical protein